MKKTTKCISALALTGMILISGPTFATVKNNPVKGKIPGNTLVCDSCGKDAGTTLKTNMRKLWEDHVTWTRNVIFCLVDNLPGADQAVNRLMKNQEDIGNAVASYYGADAGKKLTELLKSHISISADVVKSAKASNNAALDEANKKWFANADEISAFLSKANPKWELGEMKKMMHDHLKLTTDEAVQRIKKNYEADIAAYDKVHDEILKMADMLTEGIVAQFPDKFKAGKVKTQKVAEK